MKKDKNLKKIGWISWKLDFFSVFHSALDPDPDPDPDSNPDPDPDPGEVLNQCLGSGSGS